MLQWQWFMKSTPSWAVFSLFALAAAGCPSLRSGNGGSGGDDDDAAGAFALEEGNWGSGPLTVNGGRFGTSASFEGLDFQFGMAGEWGGLETAWGISAPVPCSVAGIEPSCAETRFFIEDEQVSAPVDGSIDFDGALHAADRLSGTVAWEVTSSGARGDGFAFSDGATCTIDFDALFSYFAEDESVSDCDGWEESAVIQDV